MKNKKKTILSSYTILMIIILVLSVLSLIISKLSSDSQVKPASFSLVTRCFLDGFAMSAALGDNIVGNLLCIGGFLEIVKVTGALDVGISILVKKLKGKEEILIVILMFLFSIGGTTFGMFEEAIPFYVMITSTMVVAGMDALTGAIVIAFGAGMGVIGSTINPFSTIAAMAVCNEAGIVVDTGKMMALGVILWIISYLIALYFVLKYAKKVKNDKGSSFLSLQQQQQTNEEFSNNMYMDSQISTGQKTALFLFGTAFIIMVLGYIPWEDYGINIFKGWSEIFMGKGIPIGKWGFDESGTMFFLIAVIIGFVCKINEKKFIETFIKGAEEMIPVIFIISITSGASILMEKTGLGQWAVNIIAEALRNVSKTIFTPLAYILYIPLSFLVPSSSGLAGLSMPIMGPVTVQLGFSIETMIMIFSSANGIVNLFSPTAGALMGGLSMAKVEYSTYMKFAKKPLLVIAITNIIILTIAMLIL